jgi:quinohemoprotein ethanol dehydrogenase
MTRHAARLAAAAVATLVALAVSSCRSGGGPAGEAAMDRGAELTQLRVATATVDDARLVAAASEPRNWLTHGGTYAEQRYSTLERVNAGNAGQLGLAWWFDTRTTRGLEATPIVADGVMFVTASWSVVYALDARTGRELWSYDPKVPREKGRDACCDVVNRGVALYKGRVYVGTLDGRLVALDAATGAPVWEQLTVDPTKPYTITGAPRVVKGKVLIGNGGAELGVRGYLSAYDAETGALVWRFYTVPGDPAKPQESRALEAALPTWKGGEWWKIGGGGTCWDSMAYDPELDLVYVGTGNGSPWSRYVRSPGGGDNLYLSSILAVRPDTGELVWHYQETPGDTWDYTATQHIVVADLELGGETRKVLLHAPKNGFFYVIDRTNGKLVSAKPFAEVTWAKGIDPKTGRPIPDPNADYRKKAAVVKPSPHGAHNWHPMSFNPKTGLVYIPAQEIPMIFGVDKGFRYTPGGWNTGTDFALVTEAPRSLVSGSLVAWDPVKQREAWRVPYPTPWNGGTLSTAGNLVFQGTADGRFVAYAADTGKKLWDAPAQTGVVAGPVTWELDGVQYVTVVAGWGGAFALAGGDAARAAGVHNVGRVLTFALGGTAQLPPPPPAPVWATAPPIPPMAASEEEVKRGEALFAKNCSVCHGAGAVSGGVLPDLRHMSTDARANFEAIVLHGARKGQGMPANDGRLSPDDVQAILAYLSRRAAEFRAAGAGGGKD